MSSPSLPCPNNPRLLASAMGVALSTLGVQAFAQQAESTAKADSGDVLKLDEVTITAEKEEGYKAEASASRKITAPLRETPKSITVITDQVIRDSGSLSLTDALRTTSGITFGAGEGGNPAGDRPIIRGFNAESDTFIDGLRDVGAQTREIFNIERIEVAKGPGSAYTGAGSTGGSLNLISKTAKADDFLDGSFTYGSDQTRRYTLDVNRLITDSMAGRLNLMKHEANVAGRDGVDVSRWGVAPTVTFGIGGPTRAILSYYHLETDDMPDYGIPLTEASASHFKREPVSVDRDNFYGLSGRDFRESTTDSGTLRLEHDLNDNLTVSNSFRAVRTTLDYIVSNPDDSKGNVSDGLVYRAAKTRNSTAEGWVNQTDLTARFATGNVDHTLVTGIEVSDQGVHNRGYFVQGAGGTTCTAALLASGDCTSLANPSPDDLWTGSISDSNAFADTDTETLAAYVFDTLKFNEQWSLNAGLRYDDFETTAQGVTASGTTNAVTGRYAFEHKSHFWSYQLGLVFNPLPNGSVYVAWSTSSNPPGETAGEGGDGLSTRNLVAGLEPERNRNLELGTKWDLFHNRLGLNAAIFRTEKTNARVTAADGVTKENIGETRVDGFELGASGQITRRWSVFANYTYLDAEIVDGGTVDIDPTSVTNRVGGGFDGNVTPSTPQNSFSLWSTYQVLPKLSVGGGANYVDSRFGDVGNYIEVPSYWRYDAMAKYVVNKHLDLQLNVQNLTDKRYFDQVYGSHYAHVAPGRTALLSTNFHF